MATFEFIQKNNSAVVILPTGVQHTISAGGFRPSFNSSPSTEFYVNNFEIARYSFVIDVGTDTIIGIGSEATTPTELYDALEALFFLDESGSGSTTRLASSRNSNISADGKSGRLDPSGLAGWYFENEYQGEKVNWYYVYNQNQDNVMTLKTLTSMYAVVTIYKEREFHFSVYTKRENDGQ